MLQALIVEPLSLLVNKCQNQNIIGGFCTDSISSSGYIDLQKETGLVLVCIKKSRQIQMRQILASFSVW